MRFGRWSHSVKELSAVAQASGVTAAASPATCSGVAAAAAAGGGGGDTAVASVVDVRR
jgi:hypothetical protein